jgi:hypothetical protein
MICTFLPPAARGALFKQLKPGAQEAVRECAKTMRAREPRPYLDKNKQAPNSPECRVGTNCPTNFAFSDSLLENRV